MQRDAAAYLLDADQAARLVQQFIGSRTLEDFQQDALVEAAVERQLQIVGEALAQLTRSFPDYQSRIPDLSRIIGLRNILVHGYAFVVPERIWRIATEDVPRLRLHLQQLLREVTE